MLDINDLEEEIQDSVSIGEIGNYYGGLRVTLWGGRYYWGIENYNGTYWESIPKSLYEELVRFGCHKDSRAEGEV